MPSPLGASPHTTAAPSAWGLPHVMSLGAAPPRSLRLQDLARAPPHLPLRLPGDPPNGDRRPAHTALWWASASVVLVEGVHKRKGTNALQMVWEGKDLPSDSRLPTSLPPPTRPRPLLWPLRDDVGADLLHRAGGTTAVIAGCGGSCREEAPLPPHPQHCLRKAALLVRLFLICSVIDESEPHSSQSSILRISASAGAYMTFAVPTTTPWMHINSHIIDGDVHGWMEYTLSERSTKKWSLAPSVPPNHHTLYFRTAPVKLETLDCPVN